jgi:hypothetical protein
VKYCNVYTRVAVVRARHGPHRLVASCLPLVTQLEQIPVSLKTLYTGATLMQCNKFLVVSCFYLYNVLYNHCVKFKSEICLIFIFVHFPFFSSTYCGCFVFLLSLLSVPQMYKKKIKKIVL